jgi:hypothetical protein
MMSESRAAVDDLWRCGVCRAYYFYLLSNCSIAELERRIECPA